MSQPPYTHSNIEIFGSFPGRLAEWAEYTERVNKLGLSCAKLSVASAKLHTSLSSDQLKLATN